MKITEWAVAQRGFCRVCGKKKIKGPLLGYDDESGKPVYAQNCPDFQSWNPGIMVKALSPFLRLWELDNPHSGTYRR